VSPGVLVSVEIEFKANQRGLPKELHQALGLTRPVHQPVELLDRDHDHAVPALPRDELRPFRAHKSEHFAETSLGCLELPAWTRQRRVLDVGRSGLALWFLESLGHRNSS